jgi:heme exporter protein A
VHESNHAPLLLARGLACERGDRCLFDRLDLELRPGELLWVHGRNGRGKTSLLRLLAGVAMPAAGEIVRAARTPLAYVGHADALNDDLSVAEALAFLLAIHGHACDSRSLDAALAHWGLLDRRDAPVRTLSPGLRRRVALARLSALPAPAVWVLDEPFDSLDSAAAECLNALIAGHLRNAGAILFTGHAPRLAGAGLVVRELDLDALATHPSADAPGSPEREALVLRPAGRKLQLQAS